MKVTEGINWVITCTPAFDNTVAFFRDVMGLSVVEEGIPVTDTQFTRYAQMSLPNGGRLEIVEPARHVQHLYNAVMVSLTVDDVVQARRELVESGVEVLAPLFKSQDDVAWTYFRAPDGHVYQLQGAYKE